MHPDPSQGHPVARTLLPPRLQTWPHSQVGTRLRWCQEPPGLGLHTRSPQAGRALRPLAQQGAVPQKDSERGEGRGKQRSWGCSRFTPPATREEPGPVLSIHTGAVGGWWGPGEAPVKLPWGQCPLRPSERQSGATCRCPLAECHLHAVPAWSPRCRGGREGAALLGAARERFWYLSPLRLAASLPGRGGGVRPGAALARERRDGRRRLQGDVRLGEGRSRRAGFLGWRGALGVRAEKLRDGKEKRVRESTRQNTAEGRGKEEGEQLAAAPSVLHFCVPIHGGTFPISHAQRGQAGQGAAGETLPELRAIRRRWHSLGTARAALGSPQVPP